MKYAAKKIVWMLLTMVIVSFLAFLAFRIIPGDPTAKLLGEQATPERVEALRQELGLDRPFLERYVSWLGDFVRGDMGQHQDDDGGRRQAHGDSCMGPEEPPPGRRVPL